MSRKQLFRPRGTYTAPPTTTPTQPHSEVDNAPTGLPRAAVPTSETLLHWATRTFFDQLFKVAVDDINLDQARSNFMEVAKEVKALSADDRAELIGQVDFFVGRVKNGIEPVLQEWYKAFR